jgi:hypothetical protein
MFVNFGAESRVLLTVTTSVLGNQYAYGVQLDNSEPSASGGNDVGRRSLVSMSILTEEVVYAARCR